MKLEANERLVDSLYGALMDRLQLLETILENSAESSYAKDKDGRYIYVNRAFDVEMKLSRERVLGRTDFELLPPEQAESYRSSDLVAMQTRSMEEYETWWDNKIYLTRKLPLISPSGEILGVCGNTINITSRRRTELALHDALASLERERDNKLTNLEVITASIAHEIKQPLAAISANLSAASELIQMSPIDLDEAKASLNDAQEDVDRAVGVTDSIRSLFGRDGQPRKPVNMNDIVIETLQSLHAEVEACGVTASHELAFDLPLVAGHKRQLEAVVLNLVNNALAALDHTTDRNRKLQVITRCHDANTILVAVKDTGPGISAERLDSIFDPFVTTKSKGMGLGLAICRAIIERHGGRLIAFSDGKTGAIFQFVLPVEQTGHSTAS